MWDAKTTLLSMGMSLGTYLVGSVNISLIVTKIMGLPDMQSSGSGNPGVTNLFRVAGAKIALLVLVVDLAKAWGIVWVSGLVLPAKVAPFVLILLILGNLFPVFHRFRGGKGVAAAVGGILALSPITMLLGGGLFILIFGFFRRVSAGSLAMVASYPIIMWQVGSRPSEILTATITAAMLFGTHRANILRLVRGEEPKIRSRQDDGT